MKIIIFFILILTVLSHDELDKKSFKENAIKRLTKQDHEEFIKSNENVVVKFFSPHCPHCKKMAPTYSEFAIKMQNDYKNVHVAEVDCSMYRDVCGYYKIGGYPTILFFKNGVQTDKFTEKRTECFRRNTLF